MCCCCWAAAALRLPNQLCCERLALIPRQALANGSRLRVKLSGCSKSQFSRPLQVFDLTKSNRILLTDNLRCALIASQKTTGKQTRRRALEQTRIWLETVLIGPFRSVSSSSTMCLIFLLQVERRFDYLTRWMRKLDWPKLLLRMHF